MLHILDADASKVIEAVRSTGVVITESMRLYAHYLVSNMKNIGTWQNSNAVYGFVGGTAGSHKWNWKDLRDVDAAFRLVPATSGGAVITNNQNGASGVVGSAGLNFACFNTFIIPSTHLTNGNFGFSFYVTVDDAIADVSFGNSSTTSTIQGIIRRNNTRIFILTNSSNTSTQNTYPSLSDQKGYHLSKISATTLNYFFKGLKETQTASVTGVTGAITSSLFLMGRNQGSGAATGSAKTYGYFDIYNSAPTDLQAQQQSQIVTNAQAILNRA